MMNLTKTQLRILQSHLSHTHSESMSDMEYSSKMLTVEQCVSWLDIRIKSLRPPQYCENCKLKRSVENWKPSEEQMEALKDAVRLFKETHFEKFHYKIESLYNDLKKLM